MKRWDEELGRGFFGRGRQPSRIIVSMSLKSE